MVTTPTVWKDEFGLTTFTNSAQLDPVFTDIGNGRFVAVWTDFGGGVGKFGVNVIAQIFDAEGNAVGDPFLANESAASQFEQQPAVTGRPGGGFAVAYFDNELGLTDKERIIVDIFDVDGNHVGGKVIQADDADAVSNPSIAMRSDGSYLVTYIREHTSGDGTFDVVGRRVSSSGTVGSEFTIFDSTDTSTNMADHTAETAVLSNGSYVVAYTALTTDHDPQFKIIGQTGAVSSGTGFQISLSSNDETDIQVAALANGGFVAVWQTDNDGSGSGIRFSVYDNNGAAVKANQFGGGIAVNTTTSGEQVTPDVTALADGGFVVVWDDDQRSGTYGQRFDASGNKVGGEFLVHSGTAGDQAVAALSDGRFVTGFKTNGSSSDVFGAIFDPRTSPVNGTSGDDVLTSR
ncbi:MAG: hypothetical protein KDJ88_03475, partial [Bauldia sp.]|nr:hypothetical protein [Bauldia sp.]